MDTYHKKYIKYKNKYNKLKIQNLKDLKKLTGGEKPIFDFDEIFLNKDNKYISKYLLDKKISSKYLDYIKSNFQHLYKIYYEYLTNISCEEILIPIYTNTNDDSQYRVNYIEQAKYYNIDEAYILKDIGNTDNIDLKITNSFKIIVDKLRELKTYEIYQNIDKIISFIQNAKKPFEQIFCISIIDELINIIKNQEIIDKFINKNIDNNTFNIAKYMLFIKKIIIDGYYKIDDNYKIIFNKNIDKNQFINDFNVFEISLLYDNQIKDIKDIKILLEIYNKLHNIKITDSNIKKIKYFLDLLQNAKFSVIDNKDIVIDKYDSFLNEEIKEIMLQFIKKKKKFIKLYGDIQKFKIIIDDHMKVITEQQNILNIYNNLFIFKNKFVNFLNINDIININDIMNINEQQILQNININKDIYIRKIIDEFINDDTKNDKIIQITLQYIRELSLKDEDYNEDNKYKIELHSNLIILSKFKHEDKICILGRRIEPHRHSDTYCRNSIRKEIRDIFDRLPNFYYIDYYMKNHMGLQVNECIDIKKEYIQNYFDVINPDITCTTSHLYKIDGFCSTWCAYIASILLLNKHISISDLSMYLTKFDIDDDKSFINEYIEEYEKIDKTNKSEIDLFRTNFVDFFKTEIFRYSDHGFRYNYIKNLKLYTFIIYYCKFICNKYPILRLTLSYQDYIYLRDVYTLYKDNNYEQYIKEQINKSNSILINPSDKILDKNNLHLCKDKLFNHNEMCLEEETCKDIPDDLKIICGDKNNICLKLQKKPKLNENEKDNLKKYRDFYKSVILNQ
jgi:hypothetical protein